MDSQGVTVGLREVNSTVKVATTEFSKNGVGIETQSVAVRSHFIHSCTFVSCSQTGIGTQRYHLYSPPLRRNLVCRLAVGNSIGSKEWSHYCLCKKWKRIERHCRLLRASRIFGGMTPLFLIVGAALMWVVDLTPQPLHSLSKAPFRYVGWKNYTGPIASFDVMA